MATYALGYVCRYKPEIWNPFVRMDETGERMILEKTLFITRRMLPNLALNFLLEQNIIFVKDTQGEFDKSSQITMAEISEEIEKRVNERIVTERIKSL